MESKCWQITFANIAEINDLMQDFLDDFFEVNAVNYNDDGSEELVGYIGGDSFDEKAMHNCASRYGIKLPSYRIELLTSQNWLKDYVIKFDAFEVADFCVYGIHQKEAPLSDKIKLQIYAATAFGSNHQTTRACIEGICELYHQGHRPTKILDMGCGSGILSLCAAKLWQSAQIVAADIDDEAVVVTLNNAATNNVQSQINAFQSDGYSNSQIKNNAPYQLIMSNILANPLKEFAPSLAQNLSPKGYAIISGFVDNQIDEVVNSHKIHGLQLIKTYSIDNWRAALLYKA